MICKRISLFIVIGAFLGGSPLWAAPRPVPQSTTTSVRVRLSALPIARIRASFDSDSGDHVTVEWDPVSPDSLTKTVRLDTSQTWHVSFSSEQVPFSAQSAPAMYVFCGSPKIAGPLSIDVTNVLPLPNLSASAPTCPIATPPAGSIEVLAVLSALNTTDYVVKGVPQLKATITVAATPLTLKAAKSGLVATTAVTPQGRSLQDAVPPGVVELLQVIAEIALDRAKSKSFAIISSRLQKLLCEDLKWTPEAKTKVFGAGAAAISDQILPNTCEVAKRIRIQDVMTQVRAAFFAFMQDLTVLGLELGVNQLASGQFPPPLADVLRTASILVVDLAAGRTSDLTRDAQVLLVQLSNIDWHNVLPPGDAAVACGLDVGFAVMAVCHAKGGCDAREIAVMLSHPADYFNPTDVACLSTLADEWPDLELFVSRGLALIEPPPGTTPQVLAKNSINLLLDVAERIVCKKPGNTCVQQNHVVGTLEDVRRLATSVVDRDMQGTVVGAAHLIQSVLDDVIAHSCTNAACREKTGQIGSTLSKVTALLAAVSAYAETYASDAKLDAKAAHDARKKAIESLMDAATDRTQRDGDFIVSLGVAVGFQGGGQFTFTGATQSQRLYPQLTLPIGVAAQWLPKKGDIVGGHLQLSALDLAQFVSYQADGSVNPPRWDSFVTFALYGGAILGSSNNTFVIGPEIRYSPTLFTPDGQAPKGGALRVSLLLTYYVPFFDFN